MQATELFESAMDWLRAHYGEHRFFQLRDVESAVEERISACIKNEGLPYRVCKNYSLPNRRRANLVILNGDSVAVAVELQYEPSHSRLDEFQLSQFPVVFWTDPSGSVAKDAERVRQYVAEGHADAAYSVFIDEGGHYRRREPFPGVEWRDWGEGRWVLWSKVLR